MNWAIWLGVLCLFYCALSLCITFTDLGADSALGISEDTLERWDYWAEFILTLGLATWALRQTPGFEEHFTDPDILVEKYQKSGLSEQTLSEIAVKIQKAVQSDKVHQNPNLSLRGLSKHIGVMPNYVSQALNGVIGETFFDFINQSRIQDAKALLKDTQATIIEVTYAANFNSRSSFYKAFKRETGLTPSAYREKILSR